MLEVQNARALAADRGREVAIGEWLPVTQERIDRFAGAIDDRQWIHVDPARAAHESPFGTTIAHGFLTLSLFTALLRSAVSVVDGGLAINYGFNRLRFVTPVAVNSRIRGRFIPAEIDDVGGAVQVTWGVTIECEGKTKPCCVAEWLVRYYAAPRSPDSPGTA